MPRFSKSFLFPDVNVWVALTYERHEHHRAATAWFDALDADSVVCFCRFTQLSLLRLLTTAAVMGVDGVMSQLEAWAAYDRWHEDGRVLFLEEPAGIEITFRELTRQSRPDAKQWADAYLAAFANVSNMRLVTFDRAFQRLVDAVILLPLPEQ